MFDIFPPRRIQYRIGDNKLYKGGQFIGKSVNGNMERAPKGGYVSRYDFENVCFRITHIGIRETSTSYHITLVHESGRDRIYKWKKCDFIKMLLTDLIMPAKKLKKKLDVYGVPTDQWKKEIVICLNHIISYQGPDWKNQTEWSNTQVRRRMDEYNMDDIHDYVPGTISNREFSEGPRWCVSYETEYHNIKKDCPQNFCFGIQASQSVWEQAFKYSHESCENHYRIQKLQTIISREDENIIYERFNLPKRSFYIKLYNYITSTNEELRHETGGIQAWIIRNIVLNLLHILKMYHTKYNLQFLNMENGVTESDYILSLIHI